MNCTLDKDCLDLFFVESPVCQGSGEIRPYFFNVSNRPSPPLNDGSITVIAIDYNTNEDESGVLTGLPIYVSPFIQLPSIGPLVAGKLYFITVRWLAVDGGTYEVFGYFKTF